MPLTSTYSKMVKKTASVSPTVGVKHGCSFYPLLFSLYISDIDSIAEGVEGAVTGLDNMCVSHLLYADDLTRVQMTLVPCKPC